MKQLVISSRTFDVLVLPHLDAAFNLARWLVRDTHVAEDVVQESFLRAFRYFSAFDGDDARPWLLGIVRNNCFTWLQQQRSQPGFVEFDEAVVDAAQMSQAAELADPASQLDSQRITRRVDAAIRSLAPPFREVIVLRELEGLAYAEIAQIVGIPAGTVMSRLSRARAELKLMLGEFKRQS